MAGAMRAAKSPPLRHCEPAQRVKQSTAGDGSLRLDRFAALAMTALPQAANTPPPPSLRARAAGEAIHRRPAVAAGGSLRCARDDGSAAGREVTALSSLRTRAAGTGRWAGALAIAIVTVFLLAATTAHAQQASTEDRLREALRRTTADLRALQDAQAGRQAEVEEAKKQRELLQQQVDLQAARMAELEAKAGAAGVLAEREAQLAQFRQDFAAMQANNEAILQALRQWQQAYNEVADVARAKDAERQRAEARLGATQRTLGVCQEKNDKLVAVAEDTLNLYRSQDFITVLRGSWEPVLGLQKVELENIVQDYQDRILDEQFVPPPAGMAPPVAAPTDTPPATPPAAAAPAGAL